MFQGREHTSFVMRLAEVAPSRQELLQALLAAYHDHFCIQVRGAVGRLHGTWRRLLCMYQALQLSNHFVHPAHRYILEVE
jgi:hypothetical protein